MRFRSDRTAFGNCPPASGKPAAFLRRAATIMAGLACDRRIKACVERLPAFVTPDTDVRRSSNLASLTSVIFDTENETLRTTDLPMMR